MFSDIHLYIFELAKAGSLLICIVSLFCLIMPLARRGNNCLDNKQLRSTNNNFGRRRQCLKFREYSLIIEKFMYTSSLNMNIVIEYVQITRFENKNSNWTARWFSIKFLVKTNMICYFMSLNNVHMSNAQIILLIWISAADELLCSEEEQVENS